MELRECSLTALMPTLLVTSLLTLVRLGLILVARAARTARPSSATALSTEAASVAISANILPGFFSTLRHTQSAVCLAITLIKTGVRRSVSIFITVSSIHYITHDARIELQVAALQLTIVPR